MGRPAHLLSHPLRLHAAEATCKALGLDGLVVVGDDDPNANTALLAEYFVEKGEAGNIAESLFECVCKVELCRRPERERQ